MDTIFFFTPRQSSNDYYLYMVENSPGQNYWFISKRVGDTNYALAMFTLNAACPDGKN